MLTVFWCSSSYTVLIVLWKMLMEPVTAPARWWPCACLKCVSGRQRLEKTLNFLRCIHVIDLVLKYDWHKWRKLVTACLLLHCIVGYSCLRFWNGSFSAAFQVLDWSFLVLHFYGNVCNWIPCDLTTNGLILVFFVGKWLLSLTSYLYGLKFARIAQLLFFFDDINFFRCLVWGAFWSVLQKCLYFWAIGFCNIDW